MQKVLVPNAHKVDFLSYRPLFNRVDNDLATLFRQNRTLSRPPLALLGKGQLCERPGLGAR